MRQRVLRVFDQHISAAGATALGRAAARAGLSTSFGEALTDIARADGLNGYATEKRMGDTLGVYDELGLMVAVDNVSSTSAVNFDLWLDHSSDGLNWLQRSQANQTPPFHTGVGDVRLSVSQFSPGVGWYSTSGRGRSSAATSDATGPLLHYVRLYMVIASGTAHVRVHAFQRDRATPKQR
ncbi:MAG TPA: hypothetical protein VHB21_09465 [Minicystis sp.]|nr:hypothetical protein [Minicystis sp.]